MSTLTRLVKNQYFTLHPGTAPVTCGATQFRWEMHVALPFCLPARSPLAEEVTVDGRTYAFSLRSSVDRVITFPASPPSWPSVRLVARSEPSPTPARGQRLQREPLQSVACYEDRTEASDAITAFGNANEKVQACFRHLSAALSRIQRAMPYLASWQVYPLSQFDVGLVYHTVTHFCPNTRRWDHVSTGITINLARQLHHPLCRLALDEPVVCPPSLELSHELLAEAQVALFRGLLRTTVLISYQAVESFANHVFKEKQTAAFVAVGKPPATAEAEAEQLRKSNNVKIDFLVHRGLQAAIGRSLFLDDQKTYDALCQLKKLRNQVAHAGRNPTQQEAEDGYALCCDVMRWLSGIGGYPVRPLLPDTESVANEVVSLPSDINAIPDTGKAFILWALGHASCAGVPAAPYQPRLEMRVGTESGENGETR